ncbi:unnamed protein product [Sphagnum troendelagicum]|uniref:MBD domain-containing protein n=1 Tax=Sphagnum troendelagicum TaxID=128251 RepID=A0ABP0URI4_9BRYO
MASPEEAAAAAAASPTVVLSGSNRQEGVVIQELSSPPLQGWKKKKIGGIPTGKDVSYITPDGEEISSKRQLQKHLKGHPGCPTGANFDWTSGESRRRSLRLSSRGRMSSDHSEAELPVTKRSKQVVHETVQDSISPVVGGIGRKGRAKKLTLAASLAGNEEEMEDVTKDTVSVEQIQATEEKAVVEKSNGQQMQASVTAEDKIVKDTQGEKGVNTAADEPVKMDVDVPPPSINGHTLEVDKDTLKDGAIKDLKADMEVSAVATKVQNLTSDHEKKHDASEVSMKEPAVHGFTIQNEEKAEVDGQGTQVAVPALSAELIPKSSAVEELMATEQKSEVKFVEEILSEQITNFLTDELCDEDENVNGGDMDTLVDHKPQELKAVELPQPQGIHALVDDSALFGGGAKPQEEEVPCMLPDAPYPVGIST